MLQPGQQRPAAGEACPMSTATASGTPTPIDNPLVPSMSMIPTSSPSFPTAAIAGIVVGAVLIFALGSGLFFLLGRQKSPKQSPAPPPPQTKDNKRASGVPSFYSPTTYSGSTHRMSAPHPSPATTWIPVMGADGIVYQQPFVSGLGPPETSGMMHQTWPLHAVPTSQTEHKGPAVRQST